jgi:predicted metalloprotease with PDZ domain
MPKEELVKSMMDVVSHEFFHIVTPPSKEIQDFDYNDPKMSEHLWMYEGVTEYFPTIFQINQGLITEEDFTTAFQTKWSASAMNDTMSLSTMSAKRVETALQRSIHQRISKVIDRNVFGYY